MFEMAFWIALGLGALYLLFRLILRQRRNATALDTLIREKGWHLETGRGRALPEALVGETLPGLGDPVNDFTFNIYRKISGEHRGRKFLLVNCKQKPIKRTEIKDETWVFTPLGNASPYPLFSIRPASKLLDAIESADRAVAELNGVELPSRVPFSATFDEKHVVIGTSGTADLMTPARQDALLA